MFYNRTINLILLALLVIGTAASLYFVLVLPDQFPTDFAVEDGLIEYATAILLFLSGLVLFTLAARAAGYRRWLIAFYGLAFVVAAGEEVSWGQRIFGIESSEFFVENNFQGETNFHNLVVGDAHLTDVVFGTGLSIVIMLYLLVLPLLYPRAAWVRAFADRLCVPLPHIYAGLFALLASFYCAWIGLPRQWEVYEFYFSVLTCLIFLNPGNPQTFGLTDPGSDG